MAVRAGWLVAPTDTGSEVTPLDDVVGHTPGDDCACLPYVEFVPGDGSSGWMVVHHAWDGRE